MIKIADGVFPYNIDLENGYDYVRPVIRKLQSQNVSVWGWQYIYGNYPVQEAEIAVKRAIELGVNGFVINAEEEYKERNKAAAASRYMSLLRNNLGSMPLALSTFRFPTYHASFPFSQFLDRCDYNMPQVYWMKSRNTAGAQLQRCINEYKQIQPFRPIIPTGPTFKEHGWVPQEREVLEFMQVAQKLNLPAVNFWYWEGCRRDLPQFWNLVRDYAYDSPADVKLYHRSAVHIRAGSAVLGQAAIREWIAKLINEHAGAQFSLIDETADRNIHNFRWQVKDASGGQLEGRDTMGVIDDQIRYHYSFIKPA